MDNTTLPALAPSSVMDIVDRTFRIYRANFISFVALVALVIVPLTLLNLALVDDAPREIETMEDYNSAVGDQVATTAIIALIQLFLQGIVVTAILTFIASESHLGRKCSIIQAIGQIRGRLLPLVGGLLLVVILFAVVIIALAFLTNLCVVPVVFFAVVFYMGMVLYFFLVPVLVLEKVGPGFALRRASYLGRARFWPTLRFVFAIWLVMIVINIALGSFGGLVGTLPSGGGTTLETILNLLTTIIITPIMPIGLALMYYDARIRLEGLDLALQTVDKPDPRPSDVLSPEPTMGWFTLRDLGNTVLLVGLVFAFWCALFAILVAVIGSIT
ncbi:MAG: hypothetical protein HY866_07525 [Chloroflexi bacterium]|nr:hypothetical protein [Chloroflexota bacterium]